MAIKSLTEGEQLFIVRRRADLTQKEMAVKVGVSLRRYQNIELSKDHLQGGIGELYRFGGELTDLEKSILIRRRKGMKQPKLADMMQVSLGYIKAMERGKENPKRLIDFWKAQGMT